MADAKQLSKPKPFELVTELIGHKSDVRAVKFADPDTVLTASRDGSVRIWTFNKPVDHNNQVAGCAEFWQRIVRRGSSYVNSLLWMGPVGDEFPEGVVGSGDSDGVLELYPPSAGLAELATRMLLGHSRNVCTLDAATNRAWIVSGGWDGQARVWRMANLGQSEELDVEGNSVWAVLALDPQTVAAGGTDKVIRLFDVTNASVAEPHRAYAVIQVPDIVRSLCRVSLKHESGAVMACAANDFNVYLYTRDGRVVAMLTGHQSYVYTVASIPSTGELVTASEDRSLRIWRGEECIQTIIHPAVSVWSVSVCVKNGDLVTGSSDCIARIWSRDESKIAPLGLREGYLASVKMSAIPHQTVDHIDRSTIPGPEHLERRRGMKEGQVQMIKEADGTVTAHQWSVSQGWVSVGVVMGATDPPAGQAEFEGATYDYVFNVDIQEGQSPLKLPYNMADNPYDVAARFIAEHNLPITYLNEVAHFIIKSSGQDPVKTGVAGQEPEPFKSLVIPRKEYLVVLNANYEKIVNKIISTNETLILTGSKDVALNPGDINAIKSLRRALEKIPPAVDDIGQHHIKVVLRMITLWPSVERVAGLDLMRLMAGVSPRVAAYNDPHHGALIPLVAKSATEVDDKSQPASAVHPRLMMAIRAASNSFATEAGLAAVMQNIEVITSLVLQVAGREPTDPPRPNVDTAAATVLLNFAINALRSKTESTEPTTTEATRKALLDMTVEFIPTVEDAESLFRCLVAVGTFLVAGVTSDKYPQRELDMMMTDVGLMLCCSEARVRNVWDDVLKLIARMSNEL